MQLHKNKNDFKTLLSVISQKTGLNETILEKDYYVTVFLRQLSDLQDNGFKVYFKGGTALYKAIKTVGRFSEDIDLTVNTDGLENRTQKAKYLDAVTKNYTDFERLPDEGYTHKQDVLAVYVYDSFFEKKTKDSLDRFGKIKIEATSFTVSEPIEDLEVSCLIYDCASIEQKRILHSKYDVFPFLVKTITMERLFVDKLFASETYVRDLEKRGTDAAKHLYDLMIMYELERIRKFIDNEEQLADMIMIRLKEEQERLGGIPNILPKDFVFFKQLMGNKILEEKFQKMQEIYVLHDEYRVTTEEMIVKILELYDSISKNPSWNKSWEDFQI
ncbi:MAG: nucleotidyl transferase AbiEii/AbiGii toxin family protein [Acidaminococcaceae bacterium]|nr:nucleotidyl transferase AbiEii/AbiGii toxin family protein [Acidaminococcaceae bacterium]